MQDKVMKLVKEICNKESANCRSLNKTTLARQLMDIANVPSNADIQEIPLDWNDQVVVLFLVPDDVNYYSLFAGMGTDNNFHFNLGITGVLKEDEFLFFDEDKIIDINYFCK